MKKNFFDEYFYVKKSERRGLILFFTCSLLIILIFKYISEENVIISVHTNKSDQILTLGTASKPNNKPTNRAFKKKKNKVDQKKKDLFPFNPNSISKDSLKLLGLSSFCANNLEKFRKKGGKINTIAQFSKIYGMDSSLLIQLKPYLQFDSILKKTAASENQLLQKPTVSRSNPNPALPTEIMDINRADSAALVSLRGIGPYYAKKIIKFREKIGGLSHIKQLLENQVIPDSTFYSIQAFIETKPCNELRININTADYKRLISHPYLEENLVKVILQYRKNHGIFKNSEQLKNIKILNQELYEKLLPHFSF